MLINSSSHWLLTEKFMYQTILKEKNTPINCNEHQSNTMLLRVNLFLQNNPSGLLAKALWVLPPHIQVMQQHATLNRDKPNYSAVTAVLTQYTCTQNHSLQRNDTSKQHCPRASCNFLWTRIMPGIFQGSGIVTINTCYFTMCTVEIPSHFTA